MVTVNPLFLQNLCQVDVIKQANKLIDIQNQLGFGVWTQTR